MKTALLFFSCWGLVFSQIWSQPFLRMDTDPLCSQASDSRSVNLVDVNGDGWEDVFISNGLNGGQADFLYLNQGDGTFVWDTMSGLSQALLSSVGATFGDWDNDGDADAYVTSWYSQPNIFYRNDSGRFEQTLPVQAPNSFSETASWADIDQDGWLDLYATNSGGSRTNFLFLNQGNGSFARIDTGDWTTETDYSRHVLWADLDQDDDPDLLVTNEENQFNDLFLNEGQASFSQINGVPLTATNTSSMGASAGDLDNDGDLDLLITNSGYFQPQQNELFYNNGDGTFTKVDTGTIVTDLSCSFGSAFGDYDNDGDLDIAVANGYCASELENYLYENLGNGHFVRSEQQLIGLDAVCSYGLAWADLNQDGFLDLVVANCKNNSVADQPENDYFQNLGNDNHWFRVKLVGTLSNRMAIGAKVQVLAQINGQMVWQLREISTQTGYSSQNSPIVHFGLGQAAEVDSVIISWPSGLTTMLGPQDIDQVLEVIEEEPTNGLREQALPFQWQVIPNPSSGPCQLGFEAKQGSRNETIRIRLLHANGQLIWEKEIPPGLGETKVQLPTEDLPQGRYLIHLSTEKGQEGRWWEKRK